MIWDYAVPKSRVVDIFGTTYSVLGVLITPSPFYIPLGGVNREARHVVLKYYKSYPGDVKRPLGYPPFLFNGDTDIVLWIPDRYPKHGGPGHENDDGISTELVNWFLERTNREVKQLCLPRSVLVYLQVQTLVGECVGQRFAKFRDEMFTDIDVYPDTFEHGHMYPCLEKLWLWEGDPAWPLEWGTAYDHYEGEDPMHEKMEIIFLGHKHYELFHEKDLKPKDLKLIWRHKETKELCAKCGSDEHN